MGQDSVSTTYPPVMWLWAGDLTSLSHSVPVADALGGPESALEAVWDSSHAQLLVPPA